MPSSTVQTRFFSRFPQEVGKKPGRFSDILFSLRDSPVPEYNNIIHQFQSSQAHKILGLLSIENVIMHEHMELVNNKKERKGK